jgi:ubiquinone/menaquinone biosynthesis C-methylase UbiE
MGPASRWYHNFVSEQSAEPIDSSTAFELVAPYYDRLMESVPYRFWLKYLHTIWDHHNHLPQSVLDIACGTGSMSLLMAKEGMLVTGVDISGKMLDQARNKSIEEGLYVDYVEQDAADLDLQSKSFDTAISVFDSLNNIIDPEKLSRCFVKIRRHLINGALFVFDVNTAYAFKQGMFDQKSIPSDGPLQYKWKSSYNEEKRLCTVVMHFEYSSGNGNRRLFEEVHVQRAYAVQELLAMLKEAGFDPVDVYDAYSLNSQKRRSDRLFFVARAS